MTWDYCVRWEAVTQHQRSRAVVRVTRHSLLAGLLFVFNMFPESWKAWATAISSVLATECVFVTICVFGCQDGESHRRGSGSGVIQSDRVSDGSLSSSFWVTEDYPVLFCAFVAKQACERQILCYLLLECHKWSFYSAYWSTVCHLKGMHCCCFLILHCPVLPRPILSCLVSRSSGSSSPTPGLDHFGAALRYAEWVLCVTQSTLPTHTQTNESTQGLLSSACLYLHGSVRDLFDHHFISHFWSILVIVRTEKM